MKSINMVKLTNAIQTMIDAGEITFICDNLIYHGKEGYYNVGTDDDLLAVWNNIQAYKNANK